MKKILLLFVCVAVSLLSLAQQKPVRIVFDVSSKDSLVHQAAMRHVSGMAKAYPDSKFEVVVYGGALPMFVKDQSTVSKTISALAGNKNVSFKVCEVTMKRYNVERSQLLPMLNPFPTPLSKLLPNKVKAGATLKKLITKE
jgi:uncharacterized protein